MLLPRPLTGGVLIRRYKRFLADVLLDDGRRVTAHCPNSGSMSTVAIPGNRVLLSRSDDPRRKLSWTWEIAYVGEGGRHPALVNTQRPNKVVREAIEKGVVAELTGYETLRPEVSYGERSRVDLLLSAPGRRDCYVEVKNVTLVVAPGVAAFPDGVTSRGTRHLRELMRVVRAGGRSVMLFHVARHDAERVRPADHVDPLYGATLRQAAAAGVEILAYRARISEEAIELSHRVPMDLDAP